MLDSIKTSEILFLIRFAVIVTQKGDFFNKKSKNVRGVPDLGNSN